MQVKRDQDAIAPAGSTSAKRSLADDDSSNERNVIGTHIKISNRGKKRTEVLLCKTAGCIFSLFIQVRFSYKIVYTSCVLSTVSFAN